MLLHHYRELKKKMLNFRDDEAKWLGNLTRNSKECMDTLVGICTMGEKILKIAELCRKLETEREKVLPFYESQVDAEEIPDVQIEKIEGLKNQAQDNYNEYALLDNFYKRFNKVLLDKVAIEKQKEKLDKENMFIKNLLRQYLDGVSVNPDVMNSQNPLLIINNKISLNWPVAKIDPKSQLAQEGNVIVNSINL